MSKDGLLLSGQSGSINSSNRPLKFELDDLSYGHPDLISKCGLSLETIIDFGLGCYSGNKGIMAGQIVIPIYNVNDKLVAYVGCSPENVGTVAPVYKQSMRFQKSLEVFNLNRAIKEPANKPLLIVEDFFQVFKLHQSGHRKAVALMGRTLSAVQEELIHRHRGRYKVIIVMLAPHDADEEGYLKMISRLSKFSIVRDCSEIAGENQIHLMTSHAQHA